MAKKLAEKDPLDVFKTLIQKAKDKKEVAILDSRDRDMLRKKEVVDCYEVYREFADFSKSLRVLQTALIPKRSRNKTTNQKPPLTTTK